MIPTMTVRMTLVLLLLCLGFVHLTFSSTRLRKFSFNEAPVNWSDSLTWCKQKNETPVTLYDEDDAMFATNFTKLTVWLGLRKVRNITWSNGSPVTFSNSSVNVTNGTQRCQAIENNTWKDYNCSRPKYFMCELVWGTNITNYTLVEVNKTWCQAREHCRNHHSDLVSISDKWQNDQVIDKGNNRSFWIGLMHDEWEWEDKGCSSFRKWSNPDKSGSFTSYNGYTFNPVLNRRDPVQTAATFCSRGHVRIKVIEIEHTWEDAYNYCKDNHTRLLWIENDEDQNAVAQWLNYTQDDRPFWIGLRQSRVFGFWIWSTDRVVGYSNWKNKTQPELPLSNHCGVIKKNDSYTWSDENCLFPLYFLCEEEIYFMDD